MGRNHSDVNEVDVVSVRLAWVQAPSVGQAVGSRLLRGALASRFPNNALFHQHEEGGTVYRYPCVHYRWDAQGPWLWGLGAGVDSEVEVREADCQYGRHAIRPADRLLRYRFGAPWLPLSQENYRRYRELPAQEQADERDRLAVAGLLSAMKGQGVWFPERLYAAFERWREHACRYKDVDLLGFTGTLLANIDLPDGFALGRAVSHGYGWVSRLRPEQE
jgi:hypothetical protein